MVQGKLTTNRVIRGTGYDLNNNTPPAADIDLVAYGVALNVTSVQLSKFLGKFLGNKGLKVQSNLQKTVKRCDLNTTSTRQRSEDVANRDSRDHNKEYSPGFPRQSNLKHPWYASYFSRDSNFDDDGFQRYHNNRFNSVHFEDDDAFWTRV